MPRFLNVFLRKSFGFLTVFPLKGKAVPETLTCNKWGTLGRGQTGMECSKPKYMTNAFKNTEMVYLKA